MRDEISLTYQLQWIEFQSSLLIARLCGQFSIDTNLKWLMREKGTNSPRGC